MVAVCVNKAVDKNVISAAQGQHLINEYNQLVQAHMATHGNAQIAAAVAQQTLHQKYAGNAAVKRARAALQMKANAEIAALVANSKDVMVTVDALFSPDYMNRAGTNIISLEGRTTTIRRIAESQYSRAIAALKRTAWEGTVVEGQQRAILKELVGISSGDNDAREFAQGIKRAMDYLANKYRLNGGALPHLIDWDLKHVHSPLKVKGGGGFAARDEWVNYVMPLLERSKMLNKETGVPLNDTELRTLLEGTWSNIVSDGSNRGPGFKGKASTANKWDQERILHFKDDAWFDYNEKYGVHDVVTTAIKQVQDMSRDIAMMETFGPNVELGMDYFKSLVKSELVKRDMATPAKTFGQKFWTGFRHPIRTGVFNKGIQNVSDFDIQRMGADKYIDQWMDIASGKAFGTPNIVSGRFFDNVRGWLASAQLGSAILSATGDLGTLGWTAALNDLPVSRVLQNYLKAWAGKQGAELRIRAAELSLVVEHLQANILESSVYQIDVHKGMGTVAADKVMRASGLVRHTDAARVAFSLTMAQEIAKNFGKSYDQLDKGLKRGLKVNGIDAAGWDVIRQSSPAYYDGIPHLNLADVERLDESLGGKLGQYVMSETDKAVIMSGWRFERTMKNFGAGGQWGRFAAMYKRYPVMMLLQTIGRLRNAEMTAGEKVAFGMGFPITMTILGAVALTLKDLSAGRDPRQWDGAFLLDSFFQGGAGGIMGDYVKTYLDAARQKRSSDPITPGIQATFGPAMGLLSDVVLGPAWASISARLNGKSRDEAHKAVWAELPKSAKYIPGNNLWFTRVFVDRWIEDNLQRMFNKNANRIFARTIDNRNKGYGQKFWWRPGQSLPDRVPDIGSNGQ